jgi:hypothetical protein
LIVLAEPLDVLDGTPVSRIELIPPVHQRVYRMGLEHLGVVVGEEIDEFSRVHRAALTGQQFQSPDVEPVYVLFEDFTHVKFYRRSFSSNLNATEFSSSYRNASKCVYPADIDTDRARVARRRYDAGRGGTVRH